MTRGLNIVFGIREPKPIIGAPPGRQRLRMRNLEPAKLFIKTESGARSFALIDMGHHWYCDPKLEQGRNARSKIKDLTITNGEWGPDKIWRERGVHLDCVATDGCKATTETHQR